MLKELNSLLQKFNKNVNKPVSDLNSLNEARKGSTSGLKRKVKNKIKNKIWNKIN
jgi:hypothetical protein